MKLKYNKANQHGALKAPRKKRATLLTPSYLRRYVPNMLCRYKRLGVRSQYAADLDENQARGKVRPFSDCRVPILVSLFMPKNSLFTE